MYGPLSANIHTSLLTVTLALNSAHSVTFTNLQKNVDILYACKNYKL